MSAELRGYGGRWVALRAGRLLVARDDPTEVVSWLRRHDERAETLFRVPFEGEEPAAEHGFGDTQQLG